LSIEAYKAAWAIKSEINSGAFLVLLALADHANETGKCWPSIARIAAMTKLSNKQVKRHLQTLSEESIITTVAGDGRGHTSVYTILGVIKGDIHDIKGDVDVTLLPYERVTPQAVKGGVDVTRSVYNQLNKNNGGVNGSGQYVHPLPDPICKIITALDKIAADAFQPKTEDAFEVAAYLIDGWGCDKEDVAAFAPWWEKNGYYKGRPKLKSIVDEFRNFLDARSGKAEQARYAIPEQYAHIVKR